MHILFIGDIVGRPGRRILAELLPSFKLERDIHLVIANAENASGGSGLSAGSAREIFDAGVDVLTGGNHTWQNREIFDFIDDDERVLRPANYSAHPELPGRGSGVFQPPGCEAPVAVLNLIGRVFMPPAECPFFAADRKVECLAQRTPLIIVDFHAEATSEKQAMVWHLNGRVTAVIGTHTHVPTADEHVTAAGTAAQTDAGMTGPYDSVLGVRKDRIVERMKSLMPVRHEVAKDDVRLCGLLIHADPRSGRARAVERICLKP